MSSGKLRVAQGGGSSAVINQSLVGVVLEARRFQNVKPVCGARHRVLCEEITSKLDTQRVRGDTYGYLQRSFIG